MNAGAPPRITDSLLFSDDADVGHLLSDVTIVGGKAAGLQLLPAAWRPPYVVLPCIHFTAWWNSDEIGRRESEEKSALSISNARDAWRENWPRGVILRSSSTDEALSDRGQNLSLDLAADTDVEGVAAALRRIYEHYGGAPDGAIAIIAQPLVPTGWVGHLSNERRVSKTVNQWKWEWHHPGPEGGRFNSQRTTAPEPTKPLAARNITGLLRSMQGVGRWASALGKGPCHLEMAWSSDTLWLLQLDFEDDAPDAGVDPRAVLSGRNLRAPSGAAPGWHLRQLDLAASPTGWRKLDNVRRFASVRTDAFPPLFFIEGEQFRNAPAAQVESEILAVTEGRGVCRTDCRAGGIARENLPRTDSAGPGRILAFMHETLIDLVSRGAQPHEICFILHRFIPAVAGAWARAIPGNRIVKVDSLWGVPDGLQFLPHDRFDYDVQRNMLEAERLRYKPAFIQEAADGAWSRVPVARKLGRARSISRSDVAEVAVQTQAIVEAAGRALNVMWFCGIPEAAGVGRNLPWFSMPPGEIATGNRSGQQISPRSPRINVRNLGDLDRAEAEATVRHVISLDPETDLIRDHIFLERVKCLALKHRLAVELAGSVLAHAYYQLEKAGVSVFPADEPRRQRIRGKQTFAKLVRDEIPAHIEQQGEHVALAHLLPGDARAALIGKLFEEALELRSATSPGEVTAELADLLEVLRALAATTGVAWDDVTAAADAKRHSRGGFAKGLVLLTTGWQPPDAARRAPLRSVSLKDLGRATELQDGGEVNFAMLLARGANARIRLPDGRLVSVSLSGTGVRMTVLGQAARDGGRQMSLPLDDSTEGN